MRFARVKELKDWTIEDHEKIWYSDESNITVGYGRNFVKIKEG
jgi:hypothetical protein